MIHSVLIIHIIHAAVDIRYGEALICLLAFLVGELGPQRDKGRYDLIRRERLGIAEEIFAEFYRLGGHLIQFRQIIQIYAVTLMPDSEIAAQGIQESGVEHIPGSLIGGIAPIDIIVGICYRHSSHLKLLFRLVLHDGVVLGDELCKQFCRASGECEWTDAAVQQEGKLPLAGDVPLVIPAGFIRNDSPAEEGAAILLDLDYGFQLFYLAVVGVIRVDRERKRTSLIEFQG